MFQFKCGEKKEKKREFYILDQKMFENVFVWINENENFEEDCF